MKTIKQTIKVIDKKIIINLPKDYNFDEVEVVITPSKNYKVDDSELNLVNEPTISYKSEINSQNYEIPEWQKQEVKKRAEKYSKNPNSILSIDDVDNIDDFFKEILDFRSSQPLETFISAEDFITSLEKKYDI